MKAIVFVGPTLRHEAAAQYLDAEYRDPAAQGDVLKATRERPHAIGIVDGYFESVPAVWHKEVLWALTSGIQVFGAGSMGALRAAELAPFGMIGVGKIFEHFRDGSLEDDDEVALAHGDKGTGFRPLSAPMVNIRATLAEAVTRGVLTTKEAEFLVNHAKSLFYPERTFEAVVRAAHLLPVERYAELTAFVRDHAVDQKRLDAIQMLEAMDACCKAGKKPPKPHFRFAHTEAWHTVASGAAGQKQAPRE